MGEKKELQGEGGGGGGRGKGQLGAGHASCEDWWMGLKS